MPFYEYQCKACGHTLEEMQKISAAPLRKCPECGKSSLQRLMSAPVFRLKGGGWYETDFKTDQDAKRNLADRPEADSPKEDAKDSKETKEGAAPAAKEDAAGDKKADKKGDQSSDKPAEKTPEKSAARAGRNTPSAAPAGGKKAAAAKQVRRRAAPVAPKAKPKARTAKPVKKARR